MTRRIQIFISKLKDGLHLVHDIGALRDILDATVFFASSLERVGADFQSLLPSLFESKALEIVSSHWNDGCNILEESLVACREAGIATPLFNDSSSFNEKMTGSNFEDGTPIAPRRLLKYPPLGRLANSYLTGLNDLRRCLLPGLFPSIKKKLASHLEDIDSVLQANQKAVMVPGFKGDSGSLREMSAKYRDEFSRVIKPFFHLALDSALGYDVTASFKGYEEGETEAVEEKVDSESNLPSNDSEDDKIIENILGNAKVTDESAEENDQQNSDQELSRSDEKDKETCNDENTETDDDHAEKLNNLEDGNCNEVDENSHLENPIKINTDEAIELDNEEHQENIIENTVHFEDQNVHEENEGPMEPNDG